MIVRPLIVVAALYVMIAVAAALARVPAHDMSGDAGYAHEAPAAVGSELHELRTEDIVP